MPATQPDQLTNYACPACLPAGTLFGPTSRPVLDPSGAICPFCDAAGAWLPLLCTINCTGVTEEASCRLLPALVCQPARLPARPPARPPDHPPPTALLPLPLPLLAAP